MYEDLFSENLVDEPADIERVIEGNEQRTFSGNESERDANENKSDGEDKDKDANAKDDKQPKVRKRFGPRVVLNGERLIGPRGIGIMESFFSDIKLHGKGKEKEDLETVMKRLELWTHRLTPRFHFDDCLKKIEKLGSKKIVQTHLKIARYGRNDDVVVASGLSEEAPDSPPPPPPPEDPFDQLLASSAPSHPFDTDITAEQREQMLRNRLIAEERRAARLKKAQEMRQKFLAQHASQAENTEVPSSEKVHDPNSQPVENTETPKEQSVGEIQEEDPVELRPSDETNCIVDPPPLSSQNSSLLDLNYPSPQNEGSSNNPTNISNQNDNPDHDLLTIETISDQDVEMEENARASSNKLNVLCDQVDENFETPNIEMEVDV